MIHIRFYLLNNDMQLHYFFVVDIEEGYVHDRPIEDLIIQCRGRHTQD